MQKGKPAKWRREISSVARAIRPSLSWAVPFRVGSVARCVTKCLFNLDQLCTRYVPFATRSDKRPRYAILRIRVSNRPSLNDTLKSIAKNIVKEKKKEIISRQQGHRSRDYILQSLDPVFYNHF